MDQKDQLMTAEPNLELKSAPKKEEKRKRQPRYNVLLWDDDDHSYNYVMEMMQILFGHTLERSFEIASRVDAEGVAVCLTTTMEHAELKREQVHAFGKDQLIAACAGAMSSTIEPIES